MEIKTTQLPGVYLFLSHQHIDERGRFQEIFLADKIEEVTGEKFITVQANQSYSLSGVMRGIHIAPHAKYVTVMYGDVQQIVVDTRPGSPTFGQYESVLLSHRNNPCSVLVPPGCGNAYLALSPEVVYSYQQTGRWQKGIELYLAYDDADVAVEWMNPNIKISNEERERGKTLRELFPHKFND